MKTQSSFRRHPLEDNSFWFFLCVSVIKITIVSSCEDSSMLASSIIEVEISCNHLLNNILSSGYITFFHFVTSIIYT